MVLTMREFKFDMDIILRNCERFGVEIEKGEHVSSVTMNGKPFDVTEEMGKAYEELASSSVITVRYTTAVKEMMIQNPENSISVTVGTTKKTIPEQASFSWQKSSLNAA